MCTIRASLRFEKKTEFLDKSSNTIAILLVFFEPKYTPLNFIFERRERESVHRIDTRRHAALMG